MSPVNATHAELQMVVFDAQQREYQLMAAHPTLRDSPFVERHQHALSDHRVAVAGDLAEALDRIEPGLGTRWMQAMFPEFDLAEALS